MPNARNVFGTTAAQASNNVDRLWNEARKLAALPLGSRDAVDRDAVIDSICGAARNVASADGACVVLREGELVHYAKEDAVAPLWAGQRFPMSNCISGWSIAHAERVVIDDIYADPRIPIEYYRPTFVKSLAMQPIDSGQPIGAIGVYWARRHNPGAAELAGLERIADIDSLVIANVNLRAALAAATPWSAPDARDTRPAAGMTQGPVYKSPLVWKFVPVPSADQLIRWVWQAWTHTGELHARSKESFELFSDCEKDAKAHGYVPPDQRL